MQVPISEKYFLKRILSEETGSQMIPSILALHSAVICFNSICSLSLLTQIIIWYPASSAAARMPSNILPDFGSERKRTPKRKDFEMELFRAKA